MTDRLKHHSLKPIAKRTFAAKVALAALLSTCVLAQPTYAAEQEWWFDVEVILFERNLDVGSISEKFEQSPLIHNNEYLDILTPYLTPDLRFLQAGLSYCRGSSRQAVKTQYEKDFSFPMPVGETNDSSLPQVNEPKGQDRLPKQQIVANPDITPEDSFEYKVATTDIFANSDDKTSVAQIADVKNTAQANSELVNNVIAEQQTNQNSVVEVEVVRPPLQVEFIEWQIPNVFPCAYSEQIDPGFASLIHWQNSQVETLPSNHIQRVPDVINGIEWAQKRSASLLPKSHMRMTDLYEKIKKQRDISPLLHVNWRQRVYFGRDNGKTIRLIAGQNFAQQFDGKGEVLVNETDDLFDSLNQQKDEFYLPEEELALLSAEQQQGLLAGRSDIEKSISVDLFAMIDQALADDTPIDIEQVNSQTDQQSAVTKSDMLKELWQLDGGMTVYLRNVGRVPYLHIDSNIDFRQPTFSSKTPVKIKQLSDNLAEQGAIAVNQVQQPNYLQSVNFNQLRRVISKQVHYFDHPLFGMVVSINRYRWPETDQDSEDIDDELLTEDN
ncbi:CsiV family protein [uncultured Paraglaciecola sp.]|uniref:CsiV family protein n=1 Tax=uncultured Paraglaciecola sp. TaxID=1765024 RepID=UPI0025E108E2|nr:CsiV family protein [uncultured Paraglaciecola sp.]